MDGNVLLAMIAGVVVGAVVAWIVLRGRAAAEREAAVAQAAGPLRERLAGAEARVADLEARARDAEGHREAAAARQARIAALEQQLEAERAAAAEKLDVVARAEAALADRFRTLAAEVLEANATRFAEQSRGGLAGVLDPLRERLGEFQAKVEQLSREDGKDRAALRQQVDTLVQQSTRLGEEARHLVQALRGSNKAQGNWGELILERLLEMAGLTPGREFDVQDVQRDEDGRRQLPDVVVRLPEGRSLVVDSKMSLVAFERAARAEEEAERAAARREHLASVRAHIRGLADKEYARRYAVSLDFVVMFIPIDAALLMAVTEDEGLLEEAWRRNVLLVSPSTLLFVLRTVAYLWRQERQRSNAQEIARRGATLYDKLAGFLKELDDVGQRLEAAQEALGNARRKLSTGKGSVVRQAEQLRALGVKPAKGLPEGWLADAGEEAEGDGERPAPGDGGADLPLLPGPTDRAPR